MPPANVILTGGDSPTVQYTSVRHSGNSHSDIPDEVIQRHAFHLSSSGCN